MMGENERIKKATQLMRDGFGREDIGVMLGNQMWVDKLFARLAEFGRLDDLYTGKV